MYGLMAMNTQRHEVLSTVAATVTAELAVMHLQVLASTTVLASPSVPLQHFHAHAPVRGRVTRYASFFGHA
jgi:hypothetical protein